MPVGKTRSQGTIDSFVKRAPKRNVREIKLENEIDREGKKAKLEEKPFLEDDEDVLVPVEIPNGVTKLEETKRTIEVKDDSEEPLDFTDYPPPNHPSYHFPPSPSFNHPITIAPIPSDMPFKFNSKSKAIVKPEYGLDLLYFKPFIERETAKALKRYLLEAMPWYRVTYRVRGIQINTPRWTTVFGKDSTPTPWDGYDKARPRAIPPMLLRLMQQVEQVTGETYNFTLVNYYASGTDSISYHSDSESFLGKNPCIASISLGAPRDFLMRSVNYKVNNQSEKFQLHDGDMVVMRGRTQHDWQHSIPKRKSAEGRINITFRKGIVKYATQNYNDYNVGKGPMYRWQNGQMVEQK